MTANIDAMVTAAIKAYRAGKKAEARALLEKATDLDPNNEQAWMWMSAVVDSNEDQRICLENVLYINPNNGDAKRGLEILAAKTRSGGAAAPAAHQPAPVQDDPFANASFTTTSEPFAAQETGGSVDMTIPTSSPSATYNPASEVSTNQYDDWVAGLNLGKGSSAATGDDDPYQLDDDTFAGAFADTFGFDGLTDDDGEEAFSTKSSSGNAFNEDSFASGPFKSDAFTLDSDISFGDDDDDDEGFGIGYDAPLERSTSKPLMSPATDTGDLPRFPSSKGGLDDLGVDTNEFYIGGEAAMAEIDASEYFREIPPKIKPTRVPGVDESYPVVVVLGVLVLILLNVGAAGLLISNLAG